MMMMNASRAGGNQAKGVLTKLGNWVRRKLRCVRSPSEPAIETIDYNGEGAWSRSEILARYARYAKELGIVPRDLSPMEFAKGNRRWVYPVMDKVIKGIEAGD